MYDLFVMRRRQPIRELQGVFGHLALRQRTPIHALAERLAFQQFRHQVMHAVLHSNIVDRKKIGMIQRTQHPRFLIGWFRSYSGGSSSTPSPACTSSSAKTTMADDAVGVTFTTTTSPTARRGRSPT